MYSYLNNESDKKDDSGLWLMTYSIEPHVYRRTRASLVWGNMEKRTTLVANKPESRYHGCTNQFANFQLFAEWCQAQHGYMSKDCGKFWNLDKDILIHGNKVYSPETCIFVPQTINALLVTKGRNKEKELPVGVHWNTRDKKFQANVKAEGKLSFLGYYGNPEEAHKAWQVAKVAEIHRVCTENEDVINYPRLRDALIMNADRIHKDFISGVQTH